MRMLMKMFFLFSFSAVYYSCGDESSVNKPEEPVLIDTTATNFKYPCSLNKIWYYSTKNYLTNLRPDSVRRYFSEDTIIGFGAAEFIRDTIINQDTLKVLRNSHSVTGHSHSTLELYRQSDTGLIRYAFYTNGTNFGPFRPVNNGLRFSLSGKSFNSINEIMSDYYAAEFLSDSLSLDNPPKTVLKYPISRNIEWELNSSGTTRVTKKYLDFENVTVHAGTFYCIKIKRDIYYNSAVPDLNYFFYDYFSKDGMIRRDILLKNVMVSNSKGQVIGFIDVREEAFLNLYIQ
jgi:hypothetical protein